MTIPHAEKAIRRLRRQDKVLARVMDHVGPFRLARPKSHFQTLVEAIVWQQISWNAASAIYARLLDVAGSPLRAKSVAALPVERLQSVGLSRGKAGYVSGLAEHFAAGRFPSRTVRRMDDEEVIERLTEIKGIGTWSAEMFLIFALHRLDVFPLGDLGMRRQMARYYYGREDADREELEAIGDLWRPYRTIGTWYMWSSGDADGVGFTEKVDP